MFSFNKSSLSHYLLFTVFLFFVGCQSDPVENIDPNAKMLELLDPANTGVTFNNIIQETPQFNHFVWEEIYMGGGVSIGDINNDGLPDIFLTGNKVSDKLYLNKGNFKFEDITAPAGIKQDDKWSFGTTMGDVNGDGYLDIYVCRSGPSMNADDRKNLLYINNGDNTFTEEGKRYGVDNGGVSTQATFLDYDNDGDLDLFMLNQPPNKRYIPRYNIKKDITNTNYSDHLFRNDGDKFTDVTTQAGLSNWAYGLNAVATDINDDGWVDIFVSNDYEEPDYILMNNKDGTFTNENKKQFKHVSFYGMGSDVADYNNDGFKDIAVVDMASEDHYRSKTNMGSMDIAQFWSYVDKGRHYQYMFNTLQMNNGNGSFSEIAQMAHVSKTDWSWGILFADIDNDAHKDLMITNGIKRDIRNNDVSLFIKEQVDKGNKNFDPMKIIEAMPSTPMPNYMYRNKGDFTFDNVTADWGFEKRGFSNGMSWADLDADGDLDLVINNVNAPVSIYKNIKGRLNNYLQLKLEGEGKNTFALNATASITHDGIEQTQELTLTRGYMSSSEPLLHFGVGKNEQIDKLVVTWPNGRTTTMTNVKTNQRLTLKQKDADGNRISKPQIAGLAKDITTQSGANFTHKENEFDDFKREILLPQKQSQNGPYITTADVNGDGNEDFFIGGAIDQSGQLFLGSGNNKFTVASSQPWSAEATKEDMGCLFFDADGDGDQDLYIVSGGAEFKPGAPMYQDRLYKNDGKGNFTKATGALPKMHSSGQRVIAGDFDGDNDLDLFVGGRILPGKYPAPPDSYLLLNEGGRFKDVTDTYAPELRKAGLVTDAVFVDIDKDNDLDLVVVGEWMPISVFKNNNGKFTNESKGAYVDEYTGWWYSIAAGDFDKDGDMDFIVGNLGLNNKFNASKQRPFTVFSSDFDGNGTNDVILAKYSKNNQLLPARGRQCTSEQMPYVAKKFPTFNGFAQATIQNLLPEDEIDNAIKYEVNTFESLFLKNNGAGQFTAKLLPKAAQIAPIRGIEVLDINKDGNLDVLAVGNLYQAEVETVRYDAGTGLCLLGDGKGGFEAIPTNKSKFFANKDARDIKIIDKNTVLVANNNSEMQVFELKE